MEERECLIALNAIGGMSASQKIQIIKQFGSAQDIFQSKERLASWPAASPSFIRNLKSTDPGKIFTQEEKKAKLSGIRIITQLNREFPRLLKEISDPPLALYIKGTLPEDTSKSLAIVGSRKISHYGQVVSERIVNELIAYGFWIVSGMARGVDSMAHQTAIKGGGKTIAVLGCGLDVIYPPENKNLMKHITENGAVISEFPFGTEPHKRNFPIRNRIISGLCPGLLVIEAREKSGALISANCALDEGREVLAVPGNITSPNSKGTNQLIKQGARLVEDSEDIFEELGFHVYKEEKAHSTRSIFPEMNEEEVKIISFLSYDPIPIDLIIQKSGASPAHVHNILLTLEMKGVIKQLPGKLFFRL